jgi:kinetochore protein NDC80
MFKTFLRLFKSLFRYLTKTEDEIPAMLKGLGYPFTISKTSLVAVGTPHSWPTFLGVLTWLVELLEYDRFILS